MEAFQQMGQAIQKWRRRDTALTIATYMRAEPPAADAAAPESADGDADAAPDAAAAAACVSFSCYLSMLQLSRNTCPAPISLPRHELLDFKILYI